MRVLDLAPREIDRSLRAEGLAFRCGPFRYRVRSSFESVGKGLATLYADHPLAGDDDFVDFDIEIGRGRGTRRWVRRQARFLFDGQSPFEPLPQGHAFALLEWGMNWCICALSMEHLILHAAVIERGGMAAILPAPPGSGKSTLCAALIHRGWRLLSDELALITLGGGSVVPLCRPVSLKNESIDLLRAYAPDAVFGDITPDTNKGAVGHLKPPRPHVRRIEEPALPGWVVFPRYAPGAAPELARRSKAESMLDLGRNAFNYGLLGRAGFETLAAVVNRSACLRFTYSALDDAVAVFEHLAEERAECLLTC